MQNSHKYILMITASVTMLCLSACKDGGGNTHTVADRLHDMDATKLFLDTAHNENNPAKYQNDPEYISAVKASSHVAGLSECWPKNAAYTNPVTTANTDHACLDRHGYKR